MKAYKIDLSGFTGKVREVVSEAVQKKAFEIGYEWCDSGKKIFYPEGLTVIHFAGTGKMHGSGYYGNKDILAPITAADFLALETAKEPEFKAFDRVLVRNMEGQEWLAGLFAKLDSAGSFVDISYNEWNQCIPYEGNEHLIGTTDSPK